MHLNYSRITSHNEGNGASRRNASDTDGNLIALGFFSYAAAVQLLRITSETERLLLLLLKLNKQHNTFKMHIS